MLKKNKNIMLFSVLTLLYTVGFYSLLERLLSTEKWNFILIIIVVYILLMLSTGKLLGDKEDTLVRSDNGFTYHAATFLIVNAVGFGWILIFRPTNILYQVISSLSWFVGLLVHYVESKKSLKGYDKKEVFK